MSQNEKRTFTDQALEFVATGGYLGRLPLIPGTFGTLAGLPVFFAFSFLDPLLYMLSAMALVIGAIFIAEIFESKFGVHDSKEVVIDEVAGFVLTMTWLPLTWQAVVGGFIIFRLLDGLKPFPISWIDRKVKGGVGVVADDVVAGIIANIILQIVYVRTDWLGQQLSL